ncbi:MAG: Rieske 2Fe-2S domain-containing protein, partial [Rhodospirillales bacterium]|nr:Rieske 2Fe-2S domain-containing protein [Rhodospirillales bacterium]
MPDGLGLNIDRLVEPDRVHKSCYADDGIFEQELDKIFYKSWIYIGHESQVPNAGDYWTTWVGKERMILSRAEDMSVHVLYNRCPHRGAMLCSAKSGNAGKAFRCPYHAWQFHMDGSVRQIPMKQGYEDVGINVLDDDRFAVQKAERYDIYRGFVFASLSEDGPDLLT